MTGKPPVRLTRRTRRVLLVLLTGASNLGGYPIWRLAGGTSGGVYTVIDRLEDAGWITGRDGQPGRRFYSLTAEGRVQALALLGLENGHA